jgi:hypothetical protein
MHAKRHPVQHTLRFGLPGPKAMINSGIQSIIIIDNLPAKLQPA